MPPSQDKLIVIRGYRRFGKRHLEKICMPTPFERVIVSAHRRRMGNPERDNPTYSSRRQNGAAHGELFRRSVEYHRVVWDGVSPELTRDAQARQIGVKQDHARAVSDGLVEAEGRVPFRTQTN